MQLQQVSELLSGISAVVAVLVALTALVRFVANVTARSRTIARIDAATRIMEKLPLGTIRDEWQIVILWLVRRSQTPPSPGRMRMQVVLFASSVVLGATTIVPTLRSATSKPLSAPTPPPAPSSLDAAVVLLVNLLGLTALVLIAVTVLVRMRRSHVPGEVR
jgi:hypothetical protein